MKIKRVFVFLTALILLFSASSPSPAGLTESASDGPKNIILMIADGSGFQHFKTASCYLTGSSTGLVCDSFPVKLAVTTFSASGHGYDAQAAVTNPAYIKLFPTDSAAAATAMATGRKTSNRSLGLDAEGRRLSNAVEVAASAGRVSGLITTVPFSHATPAGFSAHLQDRDKYSGLAKQMLLESPLTVLMGGGHPDFDENGAARAVKNYDYVGGPELWQALLSHQVAGLADGAGVTSAWTVIDDKAAFTALSTGKAPDRVLGVARVYQTLQQGRTPSKDWNNDGKRDGMDEAAVPAFGDPFTQTVPTLADMARAALNVLGRHPRGFFLMIEGGAVDWAAHKNQTGRMIEEEAGFNEAIQAVCDWVEGHGGWDANLVIVTADHETGYLQLKDGPVEKGRMPLVSWGIKNHTNQPVPLFAKGRQAERLSARVRSTDPVCGPTLDDTDIGRVLLDLLGRP